MVTAAITSVDGTPDAEVELASAHRTSQYRDVADDVAGRTHKTSDLGMRRPSQKCR